MITYICYIQPGLIFIPCRAQPRMDSIPNFISKLDRLSIHSSFLLEPRHHSIPQNQLNCSLAERKQIADRGSLCRMQLRKPSFRHTDSSPSWTHKSDSLPNFGVNNPHRLVSGEITSLYKIPHHLVYLPHCLHYISPNLISSLPCISLLHP
jgi:hypothetical protein